MASFLNVLIFQGNVGADPEISTHGDRTQARFSVANTRVWTDRDGNRREETTWLQVRVWGRLAETARDYVRRGGRVGVDTAPGQGARFWFVLPRIDTAGLDSTELATGILESARYFFCQRA